MIRKIEAMHIAYGALLPQGVTCKYCCNIIRRKYDKTYIKCAAYGDSCSTATDWALRNPACKLYNVPFETLGRQPLVKTLRPQRNTPVEGQMRFELQEAEQ